MGMERVPQEAEGLSLTIAVGVNNRKLPITLLMLALNSVGSGVRPYCQKRGSIADHPADKKYTPGQQCNIS